mgnify:CR=1 FL=1
MLAFARLYLDSSEFPVDFNFNFDPDHYNFPMTGFCFIGLVSLNDPPWKYVDSSVKKCWNAGIKVVMVTGD